MISLDKVDCSKIDLHAKIKLMINLCEVVESTQKKSGDYKFLNVVPQNIFVNLDTHTVILSQRYCSVTKRTDGNYFNHKLMVAKGYVPPELLTADSSNNNISIGPHSDVYSITKLLMHIILNFGLIEDVTIANVFSNKEIQSMPNRAKEKLESIILNTLNRVSRRIQNYSEIRLLISDLKILLIQIS